MSDPHHPLTHHGNDPEKIAKMAKINAFHVSLFAEFLAKLKATPEGDGSLLDHSLYLYGSGMGNPERPRPRQPADPRRRRRRGQDARAAGTSDTTKPTPLANLHLTLLDKVGVPLDAFADSRARSTSCSLVGVMRRTAGECPALRDRAY